MAFGGWTPLWTSDRQPQTSELEREVVRQLSTEFQRDGDMPDKSTKFLSGNLQGPSSESRTGAKR